VKIWNMHAITLCFLLIMPPIATAAECTKLSAIGHPDWQPISYLGDEGKVMEGVSYDLFRHVAQQLSIPVTFSPKTPWKRVLFQLEAGKVDAITAAFYSEKRAQFGGYTDSYLEFGLVAVVKRGRDIKIDKLEDMIGLNGIATLGDYYGAEFEDFAKGNLKIVRGQMPDQSMFEMIVQKHVDFTNLSDVNFLLKSAKHGYRDKLKAIPLPVKRNTTHILISKKSPCIGLVGKINRIISEARKSGMVDRAVKRYIEKIVKSEG